MQWRKPIVIMALLAGACTPVSAPPVDATATVAPLPAAGAVGEMQVTELALEGQGDTLLARIDAARQELGAPEDHRYVTLGDAAGGLWQGEVLNYPGRQVLFLQPAQGGARTALRVEAPLAVGEQTILETLGQMPADAAPPNVEVQFVRARLTGAGEGAETWTFDVTLAHPDTGWEDYADGWHVASPAGVIFGTRILLHPHVEEQPFTRSLSGVQVPAGTDEVIVRPHDLVSGYGEGVAVSLAESATTERYAVAR